MKSLACLTLTIKKSTVLRHLWSAWNDKPRILIKCWNKTRKIGKGKITNKKNQMKATKKTKMVNNLHDLMSLLR